MNSVSQARRYSCAERLGELSADKNVLVIGSPEDASYTQLLDGLTNEGYQTLTFANPGELDAAALAAARLIFVFTAGASPQTLVAQVGAMIGQAADASVVPIVEYADQDKAVALLELGCVDYLLSPFSSAQLQALLRRQEQVNTVEEGFVTRSAAGRRLLAMAQRVAMTRAPVLITGETGTGKELIARYIHRFSAAGSDKPFVAVNCAAIPASMLESILFGHERGAFTGAVTAQPGKFEQANGGTLLLDEVGELPLELQAKLLRVLQEQRVERLGGRREIELDVRVIAATNRNLQEEVAAGRFRADLLFRLDVLPLHISPLRERREDVLPLARRFIQRFAPQEAHKDLLTEEACQALLQYDWPGNVRELENMIQRALVLRNGLYIQARDLGLEPVAPTQAPAAAAQEEPLAADDGKAALRARGKWAEYQYIIDTIRKFDGHRGKAAESLGMTPRALRYRLKAMREQGVPVNV